MSWIRVMVRVLLPQTITVTVQGAGNETIAVSLCTSKQGAVQENFP